MVAVPITLKEPVIPRPYPSAAVNGGFISTRASGRPAAAACTSGVSPPMTTGRISECPGLDPDLLALLQAAAELELEDVAVTYRPGIG